MPPRSPLRPIAHRALAAQSDERLVRLVREGHEPAFEEIVRRYRGALVAFAAAIVSAGGAEDVVQASLEKAHRALLADAREIALRPWLFAIVRNGALNAVRREPRVDELGEAMAIAAGPSELAEQREDLDRLVVAMCALPEAQRQALVKRELEGVGHGEIAAQLGTTSTAVRGLIFRARTGLRDAMGAIVPLPVIRVLLTEGAAVGAAGGGASIALLGGAGMKGGTIVAAAVVALGTGIAIDNGRNSGGDRPAEAQAATPSKDASDREEGGSSSAASEPPPASSGGGSPSGDSSSSGSDEGSGGDSHAEASDSGTAHGTSDEVRSGEGSGSGSIEGGSSGSSSSGESGSGSGSGGSSSGPGGGEQQPPPQTPDDGGHSGPVGGGHSGSGGGETPAPLEQVPPDQGGHSGSGGSGSSGSGSSSEPLEPLEEGSSGSGSGSGSGHGSGGDDPLLDAG